MQRGELELSRRTKIEMACGWLTSRKMYTSTLTDDELLEQYEDLKHETDVVTAKNFLDQQFNPDKKKK